MKKISLMLSLVTGLLITANPLIHPVSAADKIVNVVIDGIPQKYSQPAVIRNGVTVVPALQTLKAFNVDYVDEYKEINPRGITAEKDISGLGIVVGSDVGHASTPEPKDFKLQVKPYVVNDTVMVPLKYIADVFRVPMKFDPKTNTVIVTGAKYHRVHGANNTDIVVKYGLSSYGTTSQKEYDAVISTVSGKIKSDYDLIVLGKDRFPLGGDEFVRYYQKYINGTFNKTADKNSLEYKAYLRAFQDVGPLIKAGLSSSEIERIYKGSVIAASLTDVKKNGLREKSASDSKQSSAYDLLVNKIHDSKSKAYVYEVVFAELGYDVGTVFNIYTGYNVVVIKVGNKYFSTHLGNYAEIDIEKEKKKGNSVLFDSYF